jgi:sugar phosphate isomerase/epimerase
MSMVSRRSVLSSFAGALAFRAASAANLPRPACQANGWDLDPNRFDLLLTAIKEMKELGFKGFETNIRFVQPQLPKVAEARAALEAFGLEFVGAHTNLGNYETLGVEKVGAEIAKLAEQAKQFGAKALVLSNKGLSQDGEFSADALKLKARAMDLAGRACADAGLVMAYHNHQPEFRKNGAEEKGLVESTDPKFVSFMLDIGHAWLADPEVITFFSANHSRIFGLHVRDFHNRVSVPLGQGEFPLRALADAIRKTGWHGWLIDEEERPDQQHKPGTAATGPSRKTMKETFGV